MANTFTISIPDHLKEYAHKLAKDKRLSKVISTLLDKELKKEQKNNTT
jgi:hypothetical protein